jgi:hypothetical protein
VKTDFKKTLDCYRAEHNTFRIVDVPPMQYLMVDGHGDPNTAPEYAEALAALYPVAYKLKFASKRELDRDYVVPPLEALWWADDMNSFTTDRDKSRWSWTAMLMTPDWVTPEMVDAAIETVAASDAPASLGSVRLEPLHEGRCVQTLHVGSYDYEAGILQRMHHEFIPAEGLRMRGKHHEIYLSDPRRVESAKLRTILRQPVEPISETHPRPA